MARKLELKTVVLKNGADQPPLTFDYGRVFRQMLEWGGPGGIVFDEVVRSVEALNPIAAAVEAGKDSVTLSDEQWRTVCDRFRRFPFGGATQEIVAFGRMILDAPEIS